MLALVVRDVSRSLFLLVEELSANAQIGCARLVVFVEIAAHLGDGILGVRGIA